MLAERSRDDRYCYVFERSPSTIPDLPANEFAHYLGRVAYATGRRPTEARVGDINGDGNEIS